NTAQSLEQLLDKLTLLLHYDYSNMPEALKNKILQIYKVDNILAEKKVLVIDDDIRNIFALTCVLERQGMQVVHAENGKDGIALLRKARDLSIVLMDIMMPEVDGYQAIRTIRRMPKFKNLPIIALTAKAMKSDRENSFAAGASDYLAKPVDIE